ncbi:hypothetical protein GQ53DRAFT_366541 [Thozetella sp. PMI_491]|nr:hypothetical protein GQ53DRAFT_366541 [Thozetella sp. PMI_491]
MAAYNHHPLPAPPGDEQLSPLSPQTSNLSPQTSNLYQQPSPPQHQYPVQPQGQYGQPNPYQQPQQQQQQQQQQASFPPAPPPHQQAPQYQSQRQSQQQPPPPPQQQPQRPAPAAAPVRPANQSRKSRGFSFRSNGSQDLHETSAEKEAKRLHSKADPTLAISEMEPAAVAAGVRSSLASVRDIQHRDQTGQLITEPDRSNPTRWRFERPLATINSFQEAIESGYARESVYSRRHSTAPGTAERFNPRASMAAASREYNRNSYYGNRPQSVMYGGYENEQQDEYLGPRQHSYGYPNVSQQPWPTGPPRRGQPSRMSSEPQFRGPRQNYPPNVYPVSGNQQSRETVASGSGSGGSVEHAGYQTDPTSDNSSIERKQSPPQPPNDYGIGFSQGSAQPQAFTVGIKNPGIAGPSYSNYQGNSRPNYANAPPVPQKDMHAKNAILRKPTAASISQAQQRPAGLEKRKSWFGRRFSKNN